MDVKVVKIIGAVATVGGAALGLLGNWAGAKQQDAKLTEEVSKKVAEALSKSTES